MKIKSKNLILFVVFALLSGILFIPSISNAFIENGIIFKHNMVLVKSNNTYGLITNNLDYVSSWLEDKSIHNLDFIITNDDLSKLENINIGKAYNFTTETDIKLSNIDLSIKSYMSGSIVSCNYNGATALVSTLTDHIETENVLNDYDSFSLYYTYNNISLPADKAIDVWSNSVNGSTMDIRTEIEFTEEKGKFIQVYGETITDNSETNTNNITTEEENNETTNEEITEEENNEKTDEEIIEEVIDRNTEANLLTVADRGVLREYIRATGLTITSVEAQLSSTGVEPFNKGTGVPQPGMDYSPDDEYVRTYDDLTYDVSVAVNGPLNEYTDVEVTMSLPQANTKYNLQYRWDVNSFAEGDYQLLDNGETVKFYIRDLTAGQLFTKAVILKVYNAPNGLNIKPDISAKIVGDTRVVKSNSVETAIVSGAVRLNERAYSSNNTKSTEYNGQRGRYVQYIATLASRGHITDCRKGISFPVGDITMDMEIIVEKRNISTGQQTVIDHEVFLTENGGHRTKASYGSEYHGGAPLSKGGGDSHVVDSGTTTFTKVDKNKYTITIQDYIISDHFPWKNPSGPSRSWNDDEANFYSQGFSIFIPYLNDTSGSYDIYVTPKVTGIHYTTPDGVQSDFETNTGDNHITIAAPEYLPGTYSISTIYTYANGNSSARPEWMHGNSSHMQNEDIRLSTWHHYGAARDPFKGGFRSMVVFDGRKLKVRGNPILGQKNGSNFGQLNYWFGVGTITGEQAIDANYINEGLFDWYSTLDEARTHETDDRKISAVAYDLEGWLFGDNWPLTRVDIPITVTKEANIDEVIPARTYAVYYRDEERTNPTPVFSKSKYIPSEFDSNGNVISGTHSPNSHHGGASMLVIPYKLSVTKSVSDMVGGKPASVYNISKNNEVNWTIKPGIEVPRDVIITDTITITDTLPAGLTIVDGSFNIPYDNIEILPDGSQKITWILTNYDAMGGLPTINYKTTIPLLTPDRAQFDTKVTIDADGDNRSVERFKTSSYGISVINDASFKIGKNVDKSVVETDESFTYTLTWSNNSKKSYSNGVILDILPYNNNIGNNFNGDYIIENFTVPNGSRIYYTQQDPTTIVEDPVQSGVTDWKLLTNGVKATAIKVEVDTITALASEDITFTLKPTGNRGKDVYFNTFKMGVQGMDAVLASNIVKTEVVDRTLEGKVWFDANKDGILDSNETVFSNITVKLLDSAGNSIQGKETTTDSNGYYKFDNLPIGNYKVLFELPGGTTSTQIISIDNEDGNHTELTNDNYTTPSIAYVKDTLNKVLNAGIVESTSLQKSSNTSAVYLGSEIEYQIKVMNDGKTLTGRNLTVKDILPDGLSYVDGSSNFPITVQGKTLIWEVTDIDPNTPKIIKFKARVDSISSDLSNTAYLEDDLVKDFRVDKTSNEVKVAKIEIEKSANPESGSLVNKGDAIRYNLIIRNVSNVDAVDLQVSDILPQGTVGQDYNDTITIRANSEETIYYDVTVDTNIADGSTIRNKFTVNGLESNEVTHNIGTPNLQYSKEMNLQEGELVNNNTEVTYRINVTNTGTGIATDVIVEDTLDSHLTYVTDSSSHQVTANKNKLKWTLSTVNPGETIIISFKAIASKSNQYADVIVPNTATVNGNSTNTVTFEIGSPAYRFSKTAVPADGSTIYPGETIEYTLTIENTSTIDATQVAIKDILPKGVTGIDVDTRVDIGAGQSVSIPVTVTVDDLGNKTSKVIKNKFTVEGFESNEVQHTVIKPELEISKSMNYPEGTELNNNSEIEYTINVKNISRAVATNISVQDILDNHLTFVESLGSIDPTVNGQTLDWVVPSINANQTVSLKFKVIASKQPDEGKVKIINNATVDGAKTNDVTVYLGVPTIAIEKSANPQSGSEVYEGDTIEYTLTIRNTSQINAEQLKVKDILPKGVSGKDVNETIDVPAGETRTITVNVTVDSLGDKVTRVLSNKFTIDNLESNEVTHTVVKPILEFEKYTDVPEGEFVPSGTEVSYGIIVRNVGTGSAFNIEVKDILNENLSYIPGTLAEMDSPDNYKESGVDGNKLSLTIDELKAGAETTVYFRAIATKPDDVDAISIPNTATVNGEDTNIVYVNIGESDLEFEKYSDVENETFVEEGDIINYFIRVKNNGTVPALDTVIKDVVPDGTSIVEVLNNGTVANGSITWEVDEIRPDEEIIVQFSVQVDELPENVYEKTITNIASVNDLYTNEVTHFIEKERPVVEDPTEEVETPSEEETSTVEEPTENDTSVKTSAMTRSYPVLIVFAILIILGISSCYVLYRKRK